MPKDGAARSRKLPQKAPGYNPGNLRAAIVQSAYLTPIGILILICDVMAAVGEMWEAKMELTNGQAKLFQTFTDSDLSRE